MEGIFPLIYIFVITDREFFFPSTIVVKGKGNECWERWNDVCLFFPPPFGNSDENCRSLRQDWFARRFKTVEKLIDAVESIFFFYLFYENL